MKVSTSQPFTIVYSLFQHEYLGYLFGSYMVQINSKGELTLLNQIVSTKNVKEFAAGLDKDDFELVKAIEAMQQDIILKKFNPKKLSALDFFLKVYDAQKGDKLLQEAISGYIENLKAEILQKLHDKRIYIMGNDNNPARMPIQRMPDRAKVFFHFVRNEENTHYFPILKYNNERLQIRHKNAFLVCDEPAWLIIEDKLILYQAPKTEYPLTPTYKDGFISPAGIIYFERAKKSRVSTLKFSVGRAQNVEFKKITP